MSMKVKSTACFSFCTIIAIFLCCATPTPAYSQAGTIAKKGAKYISKKAAKKGATKSITKEGAEQVAKKAVGKEGADQAVKKTAQKTAARKISKDAAGKVTYKGVTAIEKTEAKKIISKSAQRAAAVSLKRSGAKEISKSLVSAPTKKVAKEVTYITGKTMTKEAAQEVSVKLLKNLGDDGLRAWRKVVPDMTDKANHILLKDLSENKRFRTLVCSSASRKSSPHLLESYYRAIESPRFRTQTNMLRYMNNGADLYHSKGIYRKTAFGTGRDLCLKDVDGVTKIFDARSNKYLGKISGDAIKGYHIDVPFENRTLLNIYPLKNATYTTTRTLGTRGYVKNTWITDETGRTKWIITEVMPDGKFVPLKRDGNAIQSAGKIKKDFTVHGQTPNRATYINDDCGHMAGLQFGGTNDYINLLSQNAGLNKGSWKAGENACRKAMNQGKPFKRVVKCSYADKVDLRPMSFEVNQSIGGIKTIENKIYKNIIEPVVKAK